MRRQEIYMKYNNPIYYTCQKWHTINTLVILMQTIMTDHILVTQFSGKVYKYFYIYSPYMGNIQQIDPKKVYTRAWSWRSSFCEPFVLTVYITSECQFWHFIAFYSLFIYFLLWELDWLIRPNNPLLKTRFSTA